MADTFEGYDFPIIRYAEVLLNYAEAMYELGTTGKALDDALNISLNLVRLRVNPDMPKADYVFCFRKQFEYARKSVVNVPSDCTMKVSELMI